MQKQQRRPGPTNLDVNGDAVARKLSTRGALDFALRPPVRRQVLLPVATASDCVTSSPPLPGTGPAERRFDSPPKAALCARSNYTSAIETKDSLFGKPSIWPSSAVDAFGAERCVFGDFRR